MNSSKKFRASKTLKLERFFLLTGISLLLSFNTATGQSNHTVTFSGSATDFNAAEKYSATAGNTDYYVTFDASYLYIGAFRTTGSFAATDNLTVYLDSDPNATLTPGAGTTVGQGYNGVTGTLPFSANYNAHVEQNYQEMRSYPASWSFTIAGYTVWTSTTAREIKIPFSSIGSPAAVYLTMWMGYSGGIFSNAPGTTLGSGANPTVTKYFGGFGVSSASCIPVNIENLPITDIITNGVPVAGGLYGKVKVTTGTVTATNNFNIAPGGSIEVSGGTLDLSNRIILMGGPSGGTGFGSTINYTGGVITTSTTSIYFNGEGFHTGNALTFGGISIRKSFTALTGGGTTIATGGNFVILSGGFVNTNGLTYSPGSYLYYHTGGTYTAGAEWFAGVSSGIGVPANVRIGDAINPTTLSFGTASTYRQSGGDVQINANSGLTLSAVSGGDLRLKGNLSNSGTYTHNNPGAPVLVV